MTNFGIGQHRQPQLRHRQYRTGNGGFPLGSLAGLGIATRQLSTTACQLGNYNLASA